jgi:hypothetical protein
MRRLAVLVMFVFCLPAVAQDMATIQNQQIQNQTMLNQQMLLSQQGSGYVCHPERVSLSLPRFSIKSGTYNSTQHVKISEFNRSATIYYTTDGATPTQSSPRFTLRHRPIVITSTTRLQAIALSCDGRSRVASALFTLPTQPVQAPKQAVINTPPKPKS